MEQAARKVSAGLADFINGVLFSDVRLRPNLAPRDRSLVTVASLIASGQVAQVTFHLDRAMDSGLIQDQASETLSHLGFYAGWPNVFSTILWQKRCLTGARDKSTLSHMAKTD